MLCDQQSRGVAPAIVAAFLLLQLAAAALLASADAHGVSVLGFRFQAMCLFERCFDVPCPACGMTRSVILALHGKLGQALAVNPAGPLWALTAAAVSATLLCARRWTQRVALVGGTAFFAVLLGHWASALAAHVHWPVLAPG